jgi:DNA invertase Pin-like site-specific DNA recombinase
MDKVQNNTFFAYCRESVDLETGINIQKEKILKYCEYTGREISKWFIDNDATAYKYRPYYDKMMKELILSDAKGLICTHLFRFGRNTQEVLLEHGKLKSAGKELVFTEHQIDSDTTVGKAMLGMLAVFADFERDTIRERLEGGRKYARIHGTKSGKPMHRPSKQINWKTFDELTTKKLSIPAIAKVLCVSRSKLYQAVNMRKND